MPITTPLPPQPAPFGSPPITIVLTVILLVCFFVGFFSIYFCRCFLDSLVTNWNLRRTPSGNLFNPDSPLAAAAAGLDPSLIQIFPTFTYESVKGFRREKYGLECAICLGEFRDDDVLRLITVCYHVFHGECIDLWLGSHKTCPVCRRDLDLPSETLEKSLATLENVNDDDEDVFIAEGRVRGGNNGVLEHAISIAIRDEGRSGGEGTEDEVRDGKEDERHKKLKRIFSRSHSTGHSIAGIRGEEEDRYSLRLPENVKVKIITRGHATAGSCITFGEFSSPAIHGGFGEVSGGCEAQGINNV